MIGNTHQGKMKHPSRVCSHSGNRDISRLFVHHYQLALQVKDMPCLTLPSACVLQLKNKRNSNKTCQRGGEVHRGNYHGNWPRVTSDRKHSFPHFLVNKLQVFINSLPETESWCDDSSKHGLDTTWLWEFWIRIGI